MENPDEQEQLNGNKPNQEEYRSWAERHGFADWALALLWIIGAFILFQFTATIIAVALIAARQGISANPAELARALGENLDLVFIGNSTGQILFLGLATWFFTRLHTSKSNRKKFLHYRIQSDTLQKIGVTVLLIVSVQPVIWFLAWINSFIPVPDMFSNLQTTQMQMIESYLKGHHLIWLTLFHVALVPAICEETLYRGYVMRAFQKSWGIWPAIILSGFLFGLYHVQLSNLIPLASLGMLFAYLTWTTKSILPAMVAHFINNGGSVIMGTYYPKSAFSEMTPETMPPLWAVILGLAISGYIVYYLYNQHILNSSNRKNYV
ncbi:MAG TPA: type II CAAX endopeptidase family protein [Balneolaceae bacterium]|nr:type II CAAX endopeptidase family protein [Balneolaceae bacterium]